jgi:hypothetical protein
MNMRFVRDFVRVQSRDIQPTDTTTHTPYTPAAHLPNYGRKLSDLLEVPLRHAIVTYLKTDNIF